MKTYEIECEGEIHEIGLDDEGYLHALDHDEEHERVLADLGEEVSGCIDLILTIEDADEDEREDIFLRAAHLGHPSVVELMLDTGVDARAGDDYALREAARLGHAPVVAILLKHRVYINTHAGLPLREAAANGHLDVVKILVKAGAGDYEDSWDSALVDAAKYGQLDVLKYFLEEPNDADVLNAALREAVKNCNTAVLELLLEHGADVHRGHDESLWWAEKNAYYLRSKDCQDVMSILKDWIEEHG